MHIHKKGEKNETFCFLLTQYVASIYQSPFDSYRNSKKWAKIEDPLVNSALIVAA
jgi:hypothetical protein